MRHFGLPDLHGNSRQAPSDLADPVLRAQGGEGLSDRFVQRRCRDVERMRGLIQIVDNNSARLP